MPLLNDIHKVFNTKICNQQTNYARKLIVYATYFVIKLEKRMIKA